jgi:hypothetical protein
MEQPEAFITLSELVMWVGFAAVVSFIVGYSVGMAKTWQVVAEENEWREGHK